LKIRSIILSSALLAGNADARMLAMETVAPVPVTNSSGAIAYERIDGIFTGALDPKDAHNRIITDIANAPRDASGKVRYRMNFTILRPVDPARRSGVLYYQVPNRGMPPQPGPQEDGHVIVYSGWQGDIAQRSVNYWADVPVATGVIGTVLVRMAGAGIAPGIRSLSINSGMAAMSPRPIPLASEIAKAQLVIEEKGKPDKIVAPADWAFANCDTTPFPGKRDATKICLRSGIDANAAYRLTYVAKDPLVLGIGWAATRDLVAYLRSGQRDISGIPNPAGGAIRWAIGVGDSQSGNFLRSFTHLGFNADEDGKRVFDGINPNIAARQIVLNLRFGAPSGAVSRYEPGSEGTLWWGNYNDRARKAGTSSLLYRCTKSRTCPKIVETFGSAELWGLRASPGLIGTDAKADIALPANVRRYYFPSVTHGGAYRGGFLVGGEAGFPGQSCQLSGNPNPTREQMRVALKKLVDWVVKGQEPPSSNYPTLAKGDLVAPTATAMGWPAIPDAPLPDGHINPFYDYDFGPGFIARDVSGVMQRQPPRNRKILPQRVPRVNADGNEISGIPSVHLQVPLGSYTGWNVETKGYHSGENCGFAGGFIPFAKTRSERESKGDPRLSLEERYGNHDGFVAKVREAAAREITSGWLLPDDAARIIKEAEDSAVLR
jgi:hypothetical protein